MTRKYFGTDGIRGRVGDAKINPEFVLKLGWAVGKVLGRSGPGKVIIGKDTRVSGYMFESALEAGLAASGFDTRFSWSNANTGNCLFNSNLSCGSRYCN